MQRSIAIALAAVVAGTSWPAGSARSWGSEVELATDAPEPIPPEESLKRFQVPQGFHLELVAAEPHLADPVAIAFDARGRIFVCEIHGYNLEGYLDILELNKTGKLDTAVRRIPAKAKAIKQAEQEQYGTVKLLEDTDGDGRVDRSTVWADRLPACYGVVAARKGVIVLCPPEIVYLADGNDDGKVDVRKTLFGGFGLYDMWSRISNPRWGLDNWIYAVNGNASGGTIHGDGLPSAVKIGSVSFRFKPDGSAFEPCSGSSGGFGHALSDFGDRFMVTNQQHALFVAPLPHRYLARNPYFAAPNPVINISSYGRPARVYPTSRPDPWRRARGKDPAWVNFYGAVEATANGYFTAACGQTIYRAAAFPPEYRGNHFSVDSAQNLVHRCLLIPQGAGYTVRRPPGEENREFLTSTEQWFRPVNLETGPDGGLYIVDMYRDIVEDYSAIPRYLQQLYIRSLIAGADRGRIYRLVADGAPKPRRFDLTKASVEQLVSELSNRNAWWRTTAQRLLVERGDQSAVSPLRRLVSKAPTPQARLHALYTLDGLGALGPELVEPALADSHWAVRMHALQLAERWLDGSPVVACPSRPKGGETQRPGLLEKITKMVDDEHPRVRLQLGFTLGESKDPRAITALSHLATHGGNDSWMRAAIQSSVRDSADAMLAQILNRPGDLRQSRALVGPLASIVGARHRNDEIANLLSALADVQADQSEGLQIACLDGLLEGLKRGQVQMLTSVAGQKALGRLLVYPSVEVNHRALQVAGLLKVAQSAEMKKAFARASDLALDGERSIDERKAAIGLLASAPLELLGPTAEKLLDVRQPLDVQLAAAAALAESDDPGVVSLLLADFAARTPKLQAAVIDAVFQRQNRLAGLLRALKQGTLPVAGLDPIRREQLLRSPNAAIAGRAERLLIGAGTKRGRAAVLARYRAALSGNRDAKQGRKVFDDQCAKCHQLEGRGHVVGPDLSAAKNRPDETLVSDLLDPSNQITTGYQNYTIVTEDGRIFSGVLAAETATSVVLRKEEGAEQTILRKEIDEMAASTLSMMPEELEKEVSPQNVADLIAYLREALGPVPPPMVTLFDDDLSFAEALNQGEGTAAITGEDRFSGSVSLLVTPPQRWSLRIPGWEYQIAEKPGPGQFRYLRFAWKSRRGEGVMIELAADGEWPPAEQPHHRYFSGKNTTGWAAVRVSEKPPHEWVLVTRDLWKDFGSFTLTGIAPTAMGGDALFDRIELLRSLD